MGEIVALGIESDRMKAADATYVYCLVSAARRPALTRAPRGVPGSGPVRLVQIDGVQPKQWLAVSTVPARSYTAAAIEKGLSDLAWVSRAAVAHERVVEAFAGAQALLPMKLFTIFADDDRAREHMIREAARIAPLLRRVSGQREWGIRISRQSAVVSRPVSRPLTPNPQSPAVGGVAYLKRKKAMKDEQVDAARAAREGADAVFDAAASKATLARKRGAGELPHDRGSLVLDAVFLVPVRGEARFKRAVETCARALQPTGCRVSLSGPWPPYSFVQD
jgi:hypothetical protein